MEDNENYIVYNTKYNTNSSQLTSCGVEDFSELRPTESANRSLAGQVEMRIYRILPYRRMGICCAKRNCRKMSCGYQHVMLTRMNSIYESEMAEIPN